jgi:predicted XRE-type DNA-binding protein
MAKQSNVSQDQVVRGSGNVFADLGLPEAKELQTKLRLAYAINEIVGGRRLTQAGAAELLGIPQPKISSLKNYKLEGFSVERLMTFLTSLDRDVEISIRKRASTRMPARITVVAA